MRKFSGLVKAAIILIVVGVLMSLIGIFFGGNRAVTLGTDGLKVKENSIIKESIKVDKFNSIDMNVDFGDIEVIKSDRYGIDIEYNGSEDELKYKVENEVLTVTKESKEKIHFNINFNIDFTNNKTVIKVYVPEDVDLNSLNIENNSGSLKVNGINIKESNIYCDFGNVEINNITGDKINVEAKSGSIYVKDLDLKDFILNCDFGDVDAENIKVVNFEGNLKSGALDIDKIIATDAKIYSNFGDIEINGAETNGLLIDAKSGEVSVKGALRGKNTVECNFGDIDIKTTLKKEDYSYKVDMDFGDSVIDGNKVDGSTEKINDKALNSFDIICDSGDLEIEFNK